MVYPEELLHFIWRYRLYDQRNLKTKGGEALQVINTGVHNHDAGPDFEFATIVLDETRWSGHIEMHINEDDWTLHGHHLDTQYNTTVLHVIWQDGHKLNKRRDGTLIPTLVLSDYVDVKLLGRYNSLRMQRGDVACEGRIGGVLDALRPGWLGRLAVERIMEKYDRCMEWLAMTKQDWERVFLVALSRAFGTSVNREAFEYLMLRIDARLLFRYKNDPTKISSLLFGVAGFLDAEYQDDYFVVLKEEYQRLQRLHGLETMPTSYWKFMRMRPYNFPTYRLAQLSALVSSVSHWFDKLCTANSLSELFILVRNVKSNEYWATHFRFGVCTEKHGTGWTDTYLYHLAINCFIPVLFSYGQFMGRDDLKERAIGWLEEIPPERNNITIYYEKQGVFCQNASDSQALLRLKNEYCDKRRCLHCAIGTAILKH